MGQFGLTTVQFLIHIEWKTCFGEQGSIITSSSGIKEEKQIEQSGLSLVLRI